MINFIFLILIFLYPSNCFAARAGDFVYQTIELSEICSRKIIENLPYTQEELKNGIYIEAYSRYILNNKVEVGKIQNELKLNQGKISIGRHWNDNSGSIPRAKGPRYHFISGEKESLDRFSGFWKNIAQLAIKQQKLKKGYIVSRKEICSGEENFEITIYRRAAYTNQYGSEPNKYSVAIGAGEILPEIKQSWDLD